jgi:putative transposase
VLTGKTRGVVSGAVPRPLRIEFPGAVYHVMARGNNRQPIFKADSDRHLFLRTVGDACQKTGWRVHAYVLMSNHYHLLVRTPEANLVAGMKWLQGTYTQRYNRRHRLCGHLFQGRYKAVVIEEEGMYLQVVSTYIHLNPARAGLIEIGEQKLKSYCWSSYPFYIAGSTGAPAWLCCQAVLDSLGVRHAQRKGYEAYMEARVLELGIKAGRKELEEQWKVLRRGWYVGTREFGRDLEKQLDKARSGRRRESHSGPARQAHDEAAAEAMIVAGLRALGLEETQLTHLPKGAPEKAGLAWLVRQRSTVSLRWVSQRLDMGDYTRVSQAVSRVDRGKGSKLAGIRQRLAEVAKTAAQN